METIVTLLATLSIASERLTDLLKNRILWKGLDEYESEQSRLRKQKLKLFLIQAISVFSSGFTVYLATPMIQQTLPTFANPGGALVLALLVSGGSSFWNSIQQYMISIRKPK